MDLVDGIATCRDQAAYVPVQPLGVANRSLNPGSWQRVDHCPACGARHPSTFATIRCIPYERCRACGFTFANPIPPDQVLTTFYNSPFYENYRRFEANRKGIDPYFSVSFPDLRRLAQWIDLDASAQILDFGCGPGSFVSLLRDEYSFRNVDGLEISEAGREVAFRRHGLRIASAISELSEQQYDLIALIEVIEHITRPDLLIESISDLIAPGGRIFITTDSVRNLPSRFFPSHSPHYTGPSHISMFTETSIVALFSRLGFTVERVETEPSVTVLGEVLVSPFFDLDFLSPTSDEDGNDLFYVPTKLGGALGLRATRNLPKALRGLKRLDRLGGRALNRLIGNRASEHLFIMVRKGVA